jgi:hypothetical protein
MQADDTRVGVKRMWRRVAVVVALALTVGGVVVGALRLGAGSLLAAPTAASGDHPSPLASYHPREGLAASLDGRLSLQDGCVYVVTDPGPLMVLLVPKETRWDPARQEIRLDDTVVRIGDRVSMGGGLVDAEAADYVPSGCKYDAEKTLPFWQVGTILRLNHDS